MKIPNELITERLILRQYVEDDFDAFFNFLSDPTATRFLRFTEEQKTQHGARAFFYEVIQSYASYQPIFALAIIHKEKETYIGSCGLSPLSDGSSVECFYALLPSYWGSGFAVEAVSAIFRYAFSELRIEKIVAQIHPENRPSRHVAEQLGMMNQGMIVDKETGKNVNCFVLMKKDYLIV